MERSLSHGKIKCKVLAIGKNRGELERYLSISTCRPPKKGHGREEENDQWFISEMHAKPRSSFAKGFPTVLYVIASFFDVFSPFCRTLIDSLDTHTHIHTEPTHFILNMINDNVICAQSRSILLLQLYKLIVCLKCLQLILSKKSYI